MKNDSVLVRADGDKALIRKIWGLEKNIIYVINEDRPDITPIGVPKEDVYIYDPHLNINTESKIDWNMLTQWDLDLD